MNIEFSRRLGAMASFYSISYMDFKFPIPRCTHAIYLFSVQLSLSKKFSTILLYSNVLMVFEAF